MASSTKKKGVSKDGAQGSSQTLAQTIGDVEDLHSAYVHHKKTLHNFTQEEIVEVRAKLLELFDLAKRDLPWRKDREQQRKMDPKEKNMYAYQVWVSEIMLQQTRVATVIEYFNKWTAKWPSVVDLAKATQEEVNAQWSGLGYYRRARNLHKGAIYVVENFNGVVPSTVEELLQLPGVGRYTAGAISSIAFNQRVPLVDGNVIRVLSRMRAIAGNIKKKETIDLFWKLAEELVDPKRAGCFNQALMELGATICTPLSPKCGECPVQKHCLAFSFAGREKKLADNAFKNEKPSCTICSTTGLNNVPINSVTMFPVKQAKTKQREEHVAVCILERKTKGNNNNNNNQFLLVRRPNSGLLAGLWESPSVVVDVKEREEEDEEEDEMQETDKILCELEEDDDEEEEGKKKKGKRKDAKKEKRVAKEVETNREEMNKRMDKYLKEELDMRGYVVEERYWIGQISHVFSHILHKLHIQHMVVSGDIESKFISVGDEVKEEKGKEGEEEEKKPKKVEKKKGSRKGKEKEEEIREKGSVKWVEESEMEATTETIKCMKALQMYKKNGREITPETKINLKRGKTNAEDDGDDEQDKKKRKTSGEKKKKKKEEVVPANQKSISSFFTKAKK